MTDFIRGHKTVTALLGALLILILILVFAGRSIANYTVEQISDFKSKNKDVWTINPDDATQINNNGTTYQITNEAVDNSKVGGWNGVCRKIAILDGRCRVLKQEKSKADYNSQVKALAENLPKGAKYIVAYYNIFSIKGEEEKEAIAVNLGHGTYRAVPAGAESAGKTAVKFDKDTCQAALSAVKAEGSQP
jgi:outer membrane lipoprotein-sorting protein